MLIKILEPVCGLTTWPNGFREPWAHEVGEIADLDPFTAHAWVASGRATLIHPPRRKKA